MPADTFLKRHLSAFVIAGLLLLSGAYLFIKNDRELDPDYRKNWWTLSFAAPNTPVSKDFIIVNHTPSESFTYELRDANDAILATHIIKIPKKSEQHISPETSPASITEIRVWPTEEPTRVFSLYRK